MKGGTRKHHVKQSMKRKLRIALDTLSFCPIKMQGITFVATLISSLIIFREKLDILFFVHCAIQED